MKKTILFTIMLCLLFTQVFAYEIPKDLWKGIIAEDTSGDLLVCLSITSCVRNRLQKGMTHGLVAMKRKNLTVFVKKECDYALKVKRIDLENQAKGVLTQVFVLNKDYCNGAINYEHTGKYSVPKYTRNMRIVKKLYAGTKREITFWRNK